MNNRPYRFLRIFLTVLLAAMVILTIESFSIVNNGGDKSTSENIEENTEEKMIFSSEEEIIEFAKENCGAFQAQQDKLKEELQKINDEIYGEGVRKVETESLSEENKRVMSYDITKDK